MKKNYSLKNIPVGLVLNLKKAVKKITFFFLARLRPILHTNRPIDTMRIKKLLLFESGGIGDLLRVFPVIETLHDNFPDASLSMVVSPASEGLLELFQKREILSEIFYYDAHSIHKSFLKKLLLLLALRKKHYDLIYAASRGEGMGEREIMMLIIGAPYRISFSKSNIGTFHTSTVEFDYRLSILRQNLSLLKECGLNITKNEIGLQIPEKDKLFVKGVLRDTRGPIISIDPAATWMARYRMWPLDNYINLVNEMIEQFDCRIVLLGSKESRLSCDIICKESDNPSVINTCGETTISQAAAFIQESDLFIGNDSGLLHIANALRIPSIGIFGSTSPEQVLDNLENCVIVRKKLPCSPCYVHQYDFKVECKHVKCLEDIQVGDVMTIVKIILKNPI